MNQVAKIEREAVPPMMAGGAVRAIVPQSMEEAWRLASAVCKANMAPKGLDTPEKALIAILHGLEIGLTPMSALQRIAVVNGRPTIWGDAAIGLVRGSGLCEFVRETITGTGEQRVAKCEAKRRGEPEPVMRTFGVADAKKAGLWGKAGPWQQFPDRMLQLRARAFALRDGFADVLGGLYIREELDDHQSMRDASPPPAPPAQMVPPPAPKMIEAPAAAPPPHDPDTGEIVDDAPALLPAADSASLREGMIKRMPNDSTASLERWIKERATSIATLQPDDRQLIQDEWSARQADLFEREQREEHITDAG